MELNVSTWWWIAAGIAVAAELATGTFYLLMLALGLAAGALAAHAGLGFSAQLLVAAVAGGGAVALWRWRRGPTAAASSPGADRDVILDVGERVVVAAWDGNTARVRYRGAEWSARYAGSGEPLPGSYAIRAVDGNVLVLVPAA
ncbi:NfeD family protein [Caldimonas brevitalea]|uniref:Membrane protein n=1 Tax=Caldimonas brevitalea TaxID=413882 RepID=A0A0G3BT63_9BURK|nr:NfeD family protein [Caldimonas brevitalea]AKJ29715.1 membrane protein [Caldimonas brevitalea]